MNLVYGFYPAFKISVTASFHFATKFRLDVKNQNGNSRNSQVHVQFRNSALILNDLSISFLLHGGCQLEMAQGVTRSELRKVRAIVTLVGEETLDSIPGMSYQCVRGLHIYASKTEDDELSLSIWNEPKEKLTSRCLFCDRISMKAFTLAISYWRPRYPAVVNYQITSQ